MEDFNTISESDNVVKVAGTYNSPLEAHNALSKMEKPKLDRGQISIVSKNCENFEDLIENPTKWENINASGDLLSEVLTEIGTSDRLSFEIEKAIEEGMILILETGSETIGEDTTKTVGNHQTKQLYPEDRYPKDREYWNFNDHFKSIMTLPTD